MLYCRFFSKVGSVFTIATLIYLTGGNGKCDDDDIDEHRSLNLLLTVKKKNNVFPRKLQCRPAAKNSRRQGRSQLRHLLKDDPVRTMYDYDEEEEEEEESHTEMGLWGFRNENEKKEKNEIPPTLDPNMLPPSAPKLEIKTNDSVLVSWHVPLQEKFPIDHFYVEFYQYKKGEFRSKCCTFVDNKPKNKSSSEAYHEELIDCLASNFDYKFRVAASYPTHNHSYGQWSKEIHLPDDFEGEGAFDTDDL
ncbi:uncharacterized protein [Bemisia tabaci]|uniref:uncharacterized protein isoform X2 n=1 Tax=Bemisia tabaci TaxID=7038 RepID=UPI003B283A72